MRGAADTLKRVTLELGGKSPNIVFADSDLDSAVKGAINGIFYGKGEVCNAGSVCSSNASSRRISREASGRAKKMQPADPLDPKTRLGAIVSQEQMQNVLGYIEAGKRRSQAYCRRQPCLSRRQQRIFPRAHDLWRRDQRDEDCPGRDLWPGTGRARLSMTRAGGRASERKSVWACRRCLDQGHQEGPHGFTPASGGHRVDQHLRT